jgi:hypothetical protein
LSRVFNGVPFIHPHKVNFLKSGLNGIQPEYRPQFLLFGLFQRAFDPVYPHPGFSPLLQLSAPVPNTPAGTGQ